MADLATPVTPDRLTAHPLSEMYPLMSDAELAELAADIKKHGLQEPIVTYQGQILDGRNRDKACLLAGVAVQTVEFEGKDAAAFVASANYYRRHLNTEQRKEIAGKLLVDDPKRTDRAVGKLTHLDHKTVAAKRAELEGRGEIPHVETREDSKGRKVPARRAAPSPAAPIDAKARDDARDSRTVTEFLRVLHNGDLKHGLNDLLRKLRDEKQRIAELPKAERESMAREFLALLEIGVEDLKPVVAVPIVEGWHGSLNGEAAPSVTPC